MAHPNHDNPFSVSLGEDSSHQPHNDPFNPDSNLQPTSGGIVLPQTTAHPQETLFKENLNNLREICPTVDAEIVEVLLQNNDNNFEKTLNELLALSDPSYVPPVSQNPTNPRAQNQVLSDEEYAKALQEQETGSPTEQSRADEDYARAILAAEQGHIEDIERLRALTLNESRNPSADAPPGRSAMNDTSGSGLGNLVEKSKRKIIGLFGKNNKGEPQSPISDRNLDPHSPQIPQRQDNYSSEYENWSPRDEHASFDVHQEVRLERSGTSPIHSGQDFQKATASPTSPTLVDLLGDDPPENMNPIAPVSHINSNNSLSSRHGQPSSLISTGDYQSKAWQIPSSSYTSPRPAIQHVPSPSERSNNPFLNDNSGLDQSHSTSSVKPTDSRPSNPFE